MDPKEVESPQCAALVKRISADQCHSAHAKQSSAGVPPMSALGQKQTFAVQPGMSAMGQKRTYRPGPKSTFVRFGPKADAGAAGLSATCQWQH